MTAESGICPQISVSFGRGRVVVDGATSPLRGEGLVCLIHYGSRPRRRTRPKMPVMKSTSLGALAV